MEETGAGQHYRDARITTIYEGTNGVQAMDLLGRKIVRDGGEAAQIFLEKVEKTINQLDPKIEAHASLSKNLKSSVAALRETIDWMLDTFKLEPGYAGAGATALLEMMGLISGGWMLARGAIEASKQIASGTGDSQFLSSKLVTARYFAEVHLSRASSLVGPIKNGGSCVMDFDSAQF